MILSLLASLSGLASGMGLGYPGITSQLLRQDEAFTISQVSWFASITAITCPIGGPLSGFLCDKFGRRKTLIISDIVAIISWIIIGFSSSVSGDALFTQLMIGRAIIGFNIGMTSVPIVMYASEICHQSIRGRMTMLSSPFFTAFGVLTAYFLGYLISVSQKS